MVPQADLEDRRPREAEAHAWRRWGATRYDHQQERGFDFWVMRDPWGNEFCVLHPNFPLLLSGASHGPAGAWLQCHSSYSTLAAMVA